MEAKKVLITGGTKGIGLATALKFYAQGYFVGITGTNSNSFSKVDDYFDSTKIKKYTCDFSDNESFANFLVEIEKDQYDILINNAGINKIDLTHQVVEEDWDKIIKVNLKAPLKISQVLVQHMLGNKWGRIVHISSIFGNVSKSMRASYSSSKFAIKGLTKAMSLDYAKDGILVNCVSPGFIDTELTRKVLTPEQIEELVSTVPMLRLGKPKEIANTIFFLASEENSFITGQDIIIDGGFTSA